MSDLNNVTIGTDPPATRFTWKNHIDLLIQHQGTWLEFDYAAEPEVGYRLYRRLKSDLVRDFDASVSSAGAVVKAKYVGQKVQAETDGGKG